MIDVFHPKFCGTVIDGLEVASPPFWNLPGIQCGSGKEGTHLVAVLFRIQQAIEEFVDQNPAPIKS